MFPTPRWEDRRKWYIPNTQWRGSQEPPPGNLGSGAQRGPWCRGAHRSLRRGGTSRSATATAARLAQRTVKAKVTMKGWLILKTWHHMTMSRLRLTTACPTRGAHLALLTRMPVTAMTPDGLEDSLAFQHLGSSSPGKCYCERPTRAKPVQAISL